MARSPIPIAIPGRGRSGIFREYAIVRFSERFEAIATAQRADEPLPKGRLGVTRYRAVHKHLFQDVFERAGHFRTVPLSKGGSVFCYPTYIPA